MDINTMCECVSVSHSMCIKWCEIVVLLAMLMYSFWIMRNTHTHLPHLHVETTFPRRVTTKDEIHCQTTNPFPFYLGDATASDLWQQVTEKCRHRVYCTSQGLCWTHVSHFVSRSISISLCVCVCVCVCLLKMIK